MTTIRRIAHLLRRTALVSVTLAACGPLDEEPSPEPGAFAQGEETSGLAVETNALIGAAGIAISGTSNLTQLTPTHAQEFDGTFYLQNNTGKALTVDKQIFFFAAPGGYAYPGASLDEWWGSLSSSSAKLPAGPFGWGFSAPVAHLVLRVDAYTNTGARQAALKAIPILASGKSAPAASPYTTDVVVGVQGPIEMFTLTSGERWLPITGTVTDTTDTNSSLPTISAKARNASGTAIANLVMQIQGRSKPIQPFIAWAAIPSGKTVADVRITASQTIENGIEASQTRTIPVVNVTPVTITSPVVGTWAWDNGPGQMFWHAHTGGPEARYGYDLCVKKDVGGTIQEHNGDPRTNESYFCWGKPIRAAQAGTVVFVNDGFPDNNGNQRDNIQGNNEITIKHANGLFTRYAHMRQGSALVAVGQTVTAGQTIAEVGNAGETSGPHLHFHAYKIDATGRVAAVPVAVSGMKALGGASVSGVPLGGVRYQTP